MDYAFKITTNGRSVITACGALEKPLRITRVAVGSGMVPKDINLADVHELYQYVTEGAISERRHENDHLYLTIQYANSEHKEQPPFTLSEFIVYVEAPETGGETDLLYATLGDYRQPVPAYRPGVPGSVFSYPLVTVVSDEIEVRVDAPPGIVTTDMLESAMSAIEEKLEEKTQIVAEGPPTPKTNGQPGQHYFDRENSLEYICKGTTEEGGYIWEETKTTITASSPPTPNTIGTPGQHYFDTVSGMEYVCKGTTEKGEYIWEAAETIRASSPPTPETPGTPGQHYFDENTRLEYVCKGTAEDGKYIWEGTKTTISAPGPPTTKTVGTPGQHYFDTATGKEYVCKQITEDGAYIWEDTAIANPEAFNRSVEALQTSEGMTGHENLLANDEKKGSILIPFNVIIKRLEDINPYELWRYDGVDIREKFAGEMGYTDPSDWIRQRLKAHDLSGLHIKDYFEFYVGENLIKAQIGAINPGLGFYRDGNINEDRWHIDCISKDCYPEPVKWNLVDYNNGLASDSYAYLDSNLKAWLNAERATVPNGTTANPSTTVVDYTTSGLLAKFPERLRNNIGEKFTTISGRFLSGQLLTDDNLVGFGNLGKLWTLNETEVVGFAVYGTPRMAHGYCFQYDIFRDPKMRIKGIGNGGVPAVWLSTIPFSGTSTQIVLFTGNGQVWRNTASKNGYVPVCFRLYEQD